MIPPQEKLNPTGKAPVRIGPWKRTTLVWSHPANRNRRFRSLLKGVLWMVYRNLSRRPIRLQGPGYRFYCYPDNEFCKRMLLYGGLPDYHEMKFLIHCLAPGDAFLDVGANTGIYSLLAASLVGNLGWVDAFEPDERSRDRMIENVALNAFKNIRIHPQAVGKADEQVRFLRDLDVGNRIQTSLDGGLKTVEVDCVRLDRAVGARRYAVGKMDVEGAEPLVLQGGEKMLKAGNPPVWLMEFNGKLHDYGFTEMDFERWLGRRGYDLARYDAATRNVCFVDRLWETLGDEPGTGNLLAVHRASADRVAARLGRQAAFEDGQDESRNVLRLSQR